VEFANILFLSALGAIAIPVIIHLIFRLRKRIVPFGTLRFLQKIVQRNRRRLRLRDIILLILRALAVALLALAFARPYFRGPAASSSEKQRDVAFVLDDSFSMSSGRLARTNFDEAKALIREEISNLKTGDRAALVLTTGGGRIVSPLSTDHGAVVSTLRATPLSYEKAELSGALRAAGGLLAGSEAPRRIVSVASDLQRSSWNETTLSALPSADVTYQSILPPVEAPNLAVVDARPVSEFWSPNIPVRIAARIANYGTSDAKGISVRLRVGADLSPRAALTVDVPAGGETTRELQFLSAAGGEYRAMVEIDGRDGLSTDDRRNFVLRLRDKIRVVCAQERIMRGSDRYTDESYFLRMALEPRVGSADAAASPFRAERVETRWLDAAALRASDAACIIGARDLTDSQIAALADWVKEGGGVLIAPGKGEKDVPGAPLEKKLADAGLLVAKSRGAFRSGSSFYDALPLTTRDVAHPVWQPFADAPPTADVMRAKLIDQLEPVEGASVLATFEGGRPAVVELTVGKGRVIRLAFSLRPEATDLPKRKSFLPFAHSLFTLLAQSQRSSADAAFEVGAPVPVGESVGPGDLATVVDPDSGRHPLRPSSDGRAGDAPVADRPGFYRLIVERAGSRQTRTYAANVSPLESDLRSSGPEPFLAALGTAAGERRTTNVARADAETKQDSSIWALLLLALMIVLVVESLLANRILLDARGGESVKEVAGSGAERESGRAA
jgi:hypothetical protein